ncbi:nephrin [Caerostris extrusa]|uniref:Nephrin n=1 Tax=Caerostris extrusa TaxID=172846 RepID=A0AAV4THU4_CAEEX|nr:nephrin [Caerostris extrusa]
MEIKSMALNDAEFPDCKILVRDRSRIVVTDSVALKIFPLGSKRGDGMYASHRLGLIDPNFNITHKSNFVIPEATVLWWKDGESIPGFHEGVVDSTHGGKATRNRVRFNVTSADDTSTYTCQATNHVLRRTVHDTFILRVLYKPEFLLTPAERFDVLEGESTVVNLTAKANPSQVTYSWTRNGLPLLDMADGSARPSGVRYGHRAVYRGPLLELTDVSRDDDGGEYGCEAANTEGVTWTTVNINVIYPARITKLTRNVVVGSGETAEFECEAIANPFVSRMITWRRAGFDMSRTHETVEKGKSVLSVMNVSRQDAGEFECVAYNGIGSEAGQLAQLIVKYSVCMLLLEVRPTRS